MAADDVLYCDAAARCGSNDLDRTRIRLPDPYLIVTGPRQARGRGCNGASSRFSFEGS
jgi:hypothetical protein